MGVWYLCRLLVCETTLKLWVGSADSRLQMRLAWLRVTPPTRFSTQLHSCAWRVLRDADTKRGIYLH